MTIHYLNATEPLTCNAGGVFADVFLDGSTWKTSPITLVGDTTTITVFAVDVFGFQSVQQWITILKESGVAEQAVLAGSPQDNPLDPDMDYVVSEDQLSCGFDPNDISSVPLSVLNNKYPTDPTAPFYDPEKLYIHKTLGLQGYTFPDCLNPDDDGDGMPDGWRRVWFKPLG